MLRKGLIAAMMATAVALVSAAPPGEGPNSASAQEADFKGKILSVSSKEPVEGAVLQNARVKLLGLRAFLVGDSVKAPAGVQRPETTYWLPVEDILLIREYKSLEDLKKDYEASQKAKK